MDPITYVFNEAVNFIDYSINFAELAIRTLPDTIRMGLDAYGIRTGGLKTTAAGEFMKDASKTLAGLVKPFLPKKQAVNNFPRTTEELIKYSRRFD